jgi:hypothetical protein
MKIIILLYLAASLSMLSIPAYSQDKEDTTATLGLAGDNLDLYAVLDLFQKSKTIEAFEKSLNDEKSKINNLDLNLDKKVDFIKVVTKKKDSSYTFILQVDVSKTETQDVAIILLDKGKGGKISLQIVGDEELYGKDYVIEPKGNSSVTANPGYTGENPVTVNVPATTTVVVQSAPIVQYVYSPAYVPYAPPYYYGYYPPWFGFATVMAVGIYRSNHYYHHHGYYGGHYGGGNTVIINNRNSINHYNSTRNTSNTVRNNQSSGRYGNGSIDRSGSGNRPSASNRPSNSASNRAGNGASASNRQSPSTSNRQSPSMSDRQSPSASASNRQSPSRSSASSFGGSGGGRSMGGGGGRPSGGGGGRRR